MSGLELCLIGVAALFGSAIAAIAGLGGGILLMAVLLQFLDPLEVVPIHGVIQLASNSSRAVILRDDVDWAVVWRFALLCFQQVWLVFGRRHLSSGGRQHSYCAICLTVCLVASRSGENSFVSWERTPNFHPSRRDRWVPQHSVRCDGPRRCACIQIRTASPNGHGGYFRYGSDFWTFGESNALRSRWICVSRPVSFARYRDQRSNRWDLVRYASLAKPQRATLWASISVGFNRDRDPRDFHHVVQLKRGLRDISK